MKTQECQYDLTGLVGMISLEYEPSVVADCLDEVLHQYILGKFESGECDHSDAVNVSVVKSLIRHFGTMNRIS